MSLFLTPKIPPDHPPFLWITEYFFSGGTEIFGHLNMIYLWFFRHCFLFVCLFVCCLLLFKLDNHISDRTLGQSASKSLKQKRQKSRQIFQISLLENGHKWWGEGGYPWVWPVSGHNLVPSPSWDNSQVSKVCLAVSTWIKLKMSLHAFKKDPNVANQKVMIGSWHKNHLIFIIIRFRLGPDCIVHDIRLFTNYPTGEIFERGTYKELAWQNTNPRSGMFYLGKLNQDNVKSS